MHRAMTDLNAAAEASEINILLKELIKLRASQINHCEYCITLHTNDALKHGEDEKRLAAVTEWKESPLFTEREKAALLLTEEITLIAGNGISAETCKKAEEFFTATEIAELIMLVSVINTWNRMSVTSKAFNKAG